jgi:hypothetical protein
MRNVIIVSHQIIIGIIRLKQVKNMKYIARETAICRNHKILQTEAPAVLDSWVTNMPPLKTFQPQKNCFG